MADQEPLEEAIRAVLLTPAGTRTGDRAFGFDALGPDGAPRTGLSEQTLAAMARQALTRCVPGVTFNAIIADCDGNGRLARIVIDYMDEIHDPSSRTTSVDFAGPDDV